MNRDVFLSLLALDSYNRGYGQNVFLNEDHSTTGQNELGRLIGNARIVRQDITDQAQDAGFYAIAYEWPHPVTCAVQRIISYRGTNFPSTLLH